MYCDNLLQYAVDIFVDRFENRQEEFLFLYKNTASLNLFVKFKSERVRIMTIKISPCIIAF